ncbi:MAG TPA: hypothetical protein PKI11_18300, partial [Candidatus Hydrogenedentes bacterium]|nr:hypothetical protein [Candidatus Hydrogenedentota bacterium]
EVYIEVEEVWWTKPYYAAPLTGIGVDGTWSCPIVTGGYDQYATGITVYLIPAGTAATSCDPCHELPVIPEAIDTLIIDRSPEVRRISAFGYDWSVKRRDFPAGPGGNYFSDAEDAVWADEKGLHLTISERDGHLACTEVILNASYGYGAYRVVTGSRVDMLDPNVVFGMFTWETAAYQEYYRELDIEFARWGNAALDTNAQYVVQPCSACPGCGDHCHRFRADLTDEDSELTSYLVWTPDRAEFRSYYGKYGAGEVPPAEQLAGYKVFEGADIPVPGNENFRLNLWLFNGTAPTDGQPVEVLVTDFAWQPEPPAWGEPGEGEGEGEGMRRVTTNLPNYPIMGYFAEATAVSINGETVALDADGGLRHDVTLSEGVNTFTVAPIDGDKDPANGLVLEATYDPEFSTSGHALLYNYGPTGSETIVLDLDAGEILGLLPGVQIVASTHAGDFVVDTSGNVYDAGNHTVVGALPFASAPAYPVFRGNDQYCYAARRVIDFASRAVVADDFPVMADGRFARLLPGDILVQCHNLTGFTTVDLTTNVAINEAELSLLRSLWGTSAIDPSGAYGVVTSYSYAAGAVDIGSLTTQETLAVFDLLADYMGQVAFSEDGLTAFAGGYGNSYYGGGGLYAFDLADTSLVTFYPQFGASSVAVGPDGLVYVSTHYVDHFGTGTVTQGYKHKRGIDVLSWDGSSFTVVKSYYLNAPHWYHVKPTFSIKPRYAP